ncbi:MAG: helix-turn-helix transcriptional regulator [Bosea sp. (in: a-proteobacteria)]
MLSLSRIPPRQRPESFGAPAAESNIDKLPQSKGAAHIVATLEHGGMAAMAIDPLTFATLAMNERFQTLTAWPAAERELKAALRSANGTSGLIWHDESGVAHVIRCFAIAGCAEPFTLVTVSDPREEHALRFRDFVQRYSITRAEEKLLWRFLLGETLEESANGLGVSKETVKSHLRSLLAKTGTGRQAALVAQYYRAGGSVEDPPQRAASAGRKRPKR